MHEMYNSIYREGDVGRIYQHIYAPIPIPADGFMLTEIQADKSLAFIHQRECNGKQDFILDLYIPHMIFLTQEYHGKFISGL